MADNFDEPTLDTMKWSYNYPWGRQHNHQGYMREDRVVINNGVLDLEARYGRDPNAVDFNRSDFGWQVVDYTTGAINTSGKFNITQGYIETNVKLYGSIGSWPAIWMLGNGWPPEIDIMEFPRGTASGIANNNNTAMFNMHYTNGSSNASYYKRDTGLPTLTDGFHTFALEWTSSVMNFYVDGSLRHSVTDSAAIADQVNMYLLLNQGVGGWAGDVTGDFESHFWIDSVKIWQIPGASDHTWKSTVGSGSWNTGGNWSTGLVPRFEDAIARFTANNNAAVAVTWSNSRAIGGLHFDTTSTAYTIGNSSGSLQFAKAAAGANGTVFMTAATSQPQTIASRVELYDGLTVTNNSTIAPLTISGVVIGPGKIEKAGPGMLVLSGDNTFRGGIGSISGGSVGDLGVIRLTHPNAAGVGAVNLPATNASSIVVELYGDFAVNNALNTAGRLSFTFLRGARGDNSWNGPITLTGTGGGYAIEAASGSLRLNGALTTTIASASDRVFNLIGAASGFVNGSIADGATTKVGIAKSGTGTWTISSAANAYSAGTTVADGTLVATAAGALGTGPVSVSGGALRLTHAEAIGTANAVTLTGGSLVLAPNLPRATAVQPLAISGPGFVELNNNGLIVDHAAADVGAVDLVRTQIASGAIRSALATSSSRAVGYATSASLNATTFMNAPLDTSTVVMRATLAGDVNLDLAVNFDDLLVLASQYNQPAGQYWFNGDFTGDGAVNFDDLLVLAANYNQTLSASMPDPIWAMAVVPEPTAGVALVATTAGLLRRRRA
jgi:autotransporter-associated beta strand protein